MRRVSQQAYSIQQSVRVKRCGMPGMDTAYHESTSSVTSSFYCTCGVPKLWGGETRRNSRQAEARDVAAGISSAVGTRTLAACRLCVVGELRMGMLLARAPWTAPGVWSRCDSGCEEFQLMPLVYLRNRARTAWITALERLANPHRFHRVRATEWWTADAKKKAAQHPELQGLWLLQQALSPDEVAAVRALAVAAIRPVTPSVAADLHTELATAERECELMLEKLPGLPPGSEAAVEAAEATNTAIQRRDALRAQASAVPPPPPPLRTPTQWEWFEYEPRRWMAPMRPHSGEVRAAPAQVQRRTLGGFEVFDAARPDDWLDLARLTDTVHSRRDEHALRQASRGAACLRRLQAALPEEMLPGAVPPDAQCMFFQWQLLERGTAVAAHIDAATPPADTVITLALGEGGRDSVRVGHVAMRVVAGDLYAITGPARWQVDHEVHCSTSDRLSLTIRFARSDAVLGRTMNAHRT